MEYLHNVALFFLSALGAIVAVPVIGYLYGSAKYYLDDETNE